MLTESYIFWHVNSATPKKFEEKASENENDKENEYKMYLTIKCQ